MLRRRQNEKKNGLIAIMLLLTAGLLLIIFMPQPVAAPEPVDQTSIEPIVSQPYNIQTLLGLYECLPHRGIGEVQTLECTFGVKLPDGTHVALDMGDIFRGGQVREFTVGTLIRVSGLLIPIEAISTDYWQRYEVTGIMRVEEAVSVAITDFETCVAAGYPIEKIKPAQCRTPEGGLYKQGIFPE